MRPFTKKSHLQRLVETAADALDSSSGIRLSWPSNPGRALKSAVPKDATKKAGAVAGGLAALTAASAGISALRHGKEGARTDS